ncbi:L,D-transpeptidase family protein [Cyclobacterium jeungdonense]|uniref:L,D-transpeptidase family protein n=1 Tax=Cyclobacterium jeungdonense TaxID=708087 RepID=A0ABT8C425_9BACT|nr:L,D-transpeptidase family protein [Cyclobacterium jeungdonense]MDN3686802.1 L,D-transpeptidase family protein [Cyclobacterium jeungdonense]
MRSFIVFRTLLILILSILSEGAFFPTQAFSNDSNIAAEIRSLLEGNETQISVAGNPSPIHSRSTLLTFYFERAFLPGWSEALQPTCKARELLYLIRQAGFDGLVPEDYHLESLNTLFDKDMEGKSLAERELALLDILLSDAFLTYAHHLYKGKVHPEHLNGIWDIQTKQTEPSVLGRLNRALSGNHVKEELHSLRPKLLVYERMRLSMKKYHGMEKAYEDKNWIPLSIEESLKVTQRNEHVPHIREKLIFWKDLESYPVIAEQRDFYDSTMAEGVKKFQLRNGLQPDGILGRATIEALNQRPRQLMDKLAVNMERLRWLPDTTLQEFILVNIANYSLDLIRERDTLLHSKVIVGKSYRKTPVFNATMSYLVFSPTWTLPPTILKNDALPAIRKNINYLAQKNMKVIDHSGQEINPNSVDWQQMNGDNFPYLIRQSPGPQNSLGLVKFMFPNKYSVYIHDTPSRELFYREDRALSSGCIRIEKPFELAQLLLKDQPLWSDERIRSAMNGKKEQIVRLDRKIPVIILYLTFWTDSNHRENIRRDIYDRDIELLKLLRTPLIASVVGDKN